MGHEDQEQGLVEQLGYDLGTFLCPRGGQQCDDREPDTTCKCWRCLANHNVEQTWGKWQNDPQCRMDIRVAYMQLIIIHSLIRRSNYTPKDTMIARISSSGEASANRLNG